MHAIHICRPDNDNTDVPYMLSCQASDSFYRTQSEALSNQYKETHRSAKRIWIFFLVYRTYISGALVGVQFYDFCLRCGNRSHIFRISCGYPLAPFSSSTSTVSRKSENLCAVNTLKVCTTKHITHVKGRDFIFGWQVIYLFIHTIVLSQDFLLTSKVWNDSPLLPIL